MAEPKKKMSKSRSGRRRGQLNVEPISLSKCSKCQTAIKPHTVCYVCGTYGGKQIIDMNKKDKKAIEETEEAQK